MLSTLRILLPTVMIVATMAHWARTMIMTTTMATTMMAAHRKVTPVVTILVSIRSRHQRYRHYLQGIPGRACSLSATVLSTWTRWGGLSLFLRFVFQYCLFALHS